MCEWKVLFKSHICRCACKSGLIGYDCSIKTCKDDCNKRGVCANGECSCLGI